MILSINQHSILLMNETKGNAHEFHNNSSNDEMAKLWENKSTAYLVGKTIVAVRYLSTEEQCSMGWQNKSLVIFFNDDSYIFPSADNEGNNAGALFTSFKGLEEIPTIL